MESTSNIKYVYMHYIWIGEKTLECNCDGERSKHCLNNIKNNFLYLQQHNNEWGVKNDSGCKNPNINSEIKIVIHVENPEMILEQIRICGLSLLPIIIHKIDIGEFLETHFGREIIIRDKKIQTSNLILDLFYRQPFKIYMVISDMIRILGNICDYRELGKTYDGNILNIYIDTDNDIDTWSMSIYSNVLFGFYCNSEPNPDPNKKRTFREGRIEGFEDYYDYDEIDFRDTEFQVSPNNDILGFIFDPNQNGIYSDIYKKIITPTIIRELYLEIFYNKLGSFVENRISNMMTLTYDILNLTGMFNIMDIYVKIAYLFENTNEMNRLQTKKVVKVFNSGVYAGEGGLTIDEMRYNRYIQNYFLIAESSQQTGGIIKQYYKYAKYSKKNYIKKN